jgi:hypothetical protein
MKYEVFQIRLSDACRDAIEICNRTGSPERAAELYPEYRAHMNASLGKYQDGDFRYYSLVSTIEATSLQEVFDIGNIGPESAIERHRPMHSISVGDIILDSEQRFHLVAPIGFRDVTRTPIGAVA